MREFFFFFFLFFRENDNKRPDIRIKCHLLSRRELHNPPPFCASVHRALSHICDWQTPQVRACSRVDFSVCNTRIRVVGHLRVYVNAPGLNALGEEVTVI